MNAIAERYVKLVLAMGQHDAAYVDAYYGPPEWKAEARTAKRPLAEIDADARPARRASAGIAGRPPQTGDELTVAPPRYLRRQLEALRARVRMLSGDEAVASTKSRRRSTTPSRPTHPESYFQATLDELDRRLPGKGPLDRPLRSVRKAVRHPARPARAGLRSRDRRVPAADDAARWSCRRRELHGRVRHRQVVERLQLVPGQLPQPDPGQYRPADLHRPRDRPGMPRGLSRATTSTTRCSRRT